MRPIFRGRPKSSTNSFWPVAISICSVAVLAPG